MEYNTVRDLAEAIEYTKFYWLINYLGVLFGANLRSLSFWDEVVNGVSKRPECYKVGCSFGW